MDAEQFFVKWLDGGREPQNAPDPDFPEGKRLRAPEGVRACHVELPYPAKRCGFYFVRCGMCDGTALITTAGRPDDPRSIELPCRAAAGEH